MDSFFMNDLEDTGRLENFISGLKIEKEPEQGLQNDMDPGPGFPGLDYFDFLRRPPSRCYDFLPIGYVTLDEKGIVTDSNLIAAEMLGVEKSDLIHSDFMRFIHAEDQQKLTLDKDSLSDPDRQSFDIRLVKGQHLFWARVNFSFDELFYFYSRQVRIILRDITEIKKVEHENAKLRYQLQQTQRMETIGTLSSGIVHDFNNILHPIIGNLEILIDATAHDRKLHKALKNILTGANRASNLVKQILGFSYQAEPEITPLKIQPIIREILKLSRSTLPATIKITQCIDNDCGPVMADPTHISQITMNLITNAFHAMEPEGGILDVSLKEITVTREMSWEANLAPGPYACIGVADTGQGIDTAISEKIFEPYFTTKEKGTGTGLGLSVISGLVKTYAGKICVSSEPGKGSLFQVYLPLCPVPFVPSPSTRVLQTDLHGCESILFVDDDPFIVEFQQEVFEQYGYCVIPFARSLDALEEFQASPGRFDIVLCDMTMPDMTGLKLANKIKQIRPDIPVIICTGYSDQINEKNYQNMGLDGFLMKPVKKEESLELIRHLLDNR